MINWDATKTEHNLIHAIALRAHAMDKNAAWTTEDWMMDVTATHLNGRRLKLSALLKADDFNFSHDVFGIRRHLDRRTGQLGNHFIPRFSVGKKSQ